MVRRVIFFLGSMDSSGKRRKMKNEEKLYRAQSTIEFEHKRAILKA